MANNSILGGSPLGIIGLKSWYNEKSGLASFNFGDSRNVKVTSYNKSNDGSLLSGKKRLRAWPQIEKKTVKYTDSNGNEISDTIFDTQGLISVDYQKIRKGELADGYKPSELHNDSVYDTSITNIIEKLANTKASLKPGDFAYLKNLGVFPNNRLMIARRFAAPVGDNIMTKKKSENGRTSELGPYSVLISWVKETDDFLEINFGEEWQDAEADFKGILTSLGEDFGLGNLGGIAGAAGNAIPLPGFTEIFQREFLKKIGILDGDPDNIPAGNPNLIKQAKRRKLIGYSEAGSGLNCTVNIKMTCEYELKYISGIDPTIVWMDILSQITRFGTSNSDTYGLSSATVAKLNKWANDPSTLIEDVVKGIKDAIGNVVSEVKVSIERAYWNTVGTIQAAARSKKTEDPYAQATTEKEASTKILEKIGEIGQKITKGIVFKYRVKLIGIANALSGAPSTPWHITIGNPLRPVFCSGDMLTTSVTLKLGPQLAFNDLPSSITADFTLTNARPWGLQEIMGKFNSGYLRTVDVQKTYFETNTLTKTNTEEPIGILPTENQLINDNTGTQSSPTMNPNGLVSPQSNPIQQQTTNDVLNSSFGNSNQNLTPPSNPQNGVITYTVDKYQSNSGTSTVDDSKINRNANSKDDLILADKGPVVQLNK